MGKQATHIANAYKENIYVKVSTDEEKVKLGSYEGGKLSIRGIRNVHCSMGKRTPYDHKYAKDKYYLSIGPGSKQKFETDASFFGSVYVTILTSSGIVLCGCVAITPDYSLIVDQNGHIRDTKYGELWVDTSGNKYSHYY